MSGPNDDDTSAQDDPRYLFEFGIVFMLTAVLAAALLVAIVCTVFYR